MQFDVQIDSLDEIGDLNSTQKQAIQELIDELPNHRRPSNFVRTLPGGHRIEIFLRDGEGHMMHHSGVFLVEGMVAETEQGLILKAMTAARAALSQLYGEGDNTACEKVLFLRWQVPDAAFMDAYEIRDRVQVALQAFFQPFFPRLQVVIVTSQDHL